ncbi:hypothetical protein C8Q79DRAFT_84554 [Trametes meyenii]|nr:hypothetical protein C8Q79DRAFT_84554 [Trametes meyenii]
MFSQWRHAVESLAQPQKPGSQDAAAPSGEEAPARSSLDSAAIRSSVSSSSQLAESAISNLRKSLVSQRPASPANSPVTAASPEPTTTPAPKPRPAGRVTLEDRLRAKFAIGDASNTPTPASSSRASPVPTSAADHPLATPPSRTSTPTQDIPVVKGPPNPLSPASTPLPDSPLVSPSIEPPLSLDASATLLTTPPPPIPAEKVADPEPVSPTAAMSQTEVDPPKDIVALPSDSNPLTSSDETPQHISSASTESKQPVDHIAVPPQSESPEREPAPAVEPEAEAADFTQPSDDVVSGVEVVQPPSEEATQGQTLPAGDVSTEPQPEAVSESTSSVSFHHPDSPPNHELSLAEATAPSSELPLLQAPAPQAAGGTVTEAIVPRVSLDVPSRTATPDMKSADVDALQKRLRLVEQRFSDVSTSFKRLQAEKLAADRVLHELTSVESMTEVDALRDFLQNMALKNEMAQDEIRRLNGKLTRRWP